MERQKVFQKSQVQALTPFNRAGRNSWVLVPFSPSKTLFGGLGRDLGFGLHFGLPVVSSKRQAPRLLHQLLLAPGRGLEHRHPQAARRVSVQSPRAATEVPSVGEHGQDTEFTGFVRLPPFPSGKTTL